MLVDPASFKNMDNAAFAAKVNQDEEVLKRPVSLPAMKKVRLATILKYVCDQIPGTYLLYPDHIKLVSGFRVRTLVGPIVNFLNQAGVDSDPADQQVATEPLDRIMCSIPLVNVHFEDQPLQSAIREVELRTNRSIALAPQAGEKSKTSITTRLTNVPVDTAVATLAEMAGLKMVRKGNVLLVTTSERAKEFDPPTPRLPVMVAPPAPAPSAVAHNEQIEEMKKKIAELEKTIGELKNKK